MRTLLFLTLACVAALSPSLFHAQAGQWVLDGWPNERNVYFAGRTEIHADGGRLKITEWPEDSDDPTTTLETYFVGRPVVKVFPWAVATLTLSGTYTFFAGISVVAVIFSTLFIPHHHNCNSDSTATAAAEGSCSSTISSVTSNSHKPAHH